MFQLCVLKLKDTSENVFKRSKYSITIKNRQNLRHTVLQTVLQAYAQQHINTNKTTLNSSGETYASRRPNFELDLTSNFCVHSKFAIDQLNMHQ